MSYEDYNKKITDISNVIKSEERLLTTNRKGHNHRDLNFKNKQKQINTSDLNQILKIDKEYIDCEATVTVGKVNRKTIPKNRIVPSLPEGDNFTVGGCLGGIALGSNSYIHGFFNNNVIDFDVILGNGEILRDVSQTNHPELYYGIGGTYGTMGIITRVKMKLIGCKPYVKVDYLHHNKFDTFYNEFKGRINKKEDDFIEAFVNGKNDYTIVIANYVDNVDTKEILVTRDKDIFKQRHMSVYAQIANKNKSNYLRLVDYLERYSFSAFWAHYLYTPYKIRDYVSAGLIYATIPKKVIKSNELNVNKYFTAASYMVGDYKRDEYVLATDIGVPLSKLESALELSDKMTGTYPLWICPSKDNYHPDKIFCTRRKEMCEENMILDLGIYGIKNSTIPSKKVNQAFEKFSFSQGVFKGFFSTCYFEYDEFWNHFDKEKYENLRKKYHADKKFMDVYDKITYRSKAKGRKVSTFRSDLFRFFGKMYLKQINNNKRKLIK